MMLLALSGCSASSRSPKQALIGFLEDSTLGNIDAAYQRVTENIASAVIAPALCGLSTDSRARAASYSINCGAGEPGRAYSTEPDSQMAHHGCDYNGTLPIRKSSNRLRFLRR